MDLKSSFAVVFLLCMPFCAPLAPPAHMIPDLLIRVGSVPPPPPFCKLLLFLCFYGKKMAKPLKVKPIVWLLYKPLLGVFEVWSFSRSYGFSMLSN